MCVLRQTDGEKSRIGDRQGAHYGDFAVEEHKEVPCRTKLAKVETFLRNGNHAAEGFHGSCRRCERLGEIYFSSWRCVSAVNGKGKSGVEY